MLNYNRKTISTDIIDVQKLDKIINKSVSMYDKYDEQISQQEIHNNTKPIEQIPTDKNIELTQDQKIDDENIKQLSQKEPNKNIDKKDNNIQNNLLFDGKQVNAQNENIHVPMHSEQNNVIIVETNYEKRQFIFYDKTKKYLGDFNILQLIKYVISKSVFLEGIDYSATVPLIEKFICVKHDQDIKLINYLESPFMANIETLIKMYTLINEFESAQYDYELNKIHDNNIRMQIKNTFNKFVYLLLNHILQIIAIMTSRITNEQFNIKDKLLNYSIAIVYKLTKLINSEIEIKNSEMKQLNNDAIKIDNERTLLTQKLDDVQNKLNKQNNEIDLLVRSIILQNSQKNNDSDASNETSIYDIDNISSLSDSNSITNTENLNTPSASQSVTSSLDKINIYNIDTETGKETLKNIKYNDLLNSESKLSTNNVETFMDMLNSHMLSSSHLNSYESVYHPDTKSIDYLSSNANTI